MKKNTFNKKGLTLIELLAVIAIIAILFILLIPSISSSFEKARTSGVQTDFRSYQIAGKTYFIEQSGKAKTEAGFNKYLDKTLQFTNGVSKEKNPWGNPYELELISGGFKVIAKSNVTAFVFNDILYAEDVIQYELILKEVNGEFAMDLKGFDSPIIGQSTTTQDPNEDDTLSNDANNDGYDDRANVEKKAFTYSDNGDGTIVITGYSGNVSDLVLPSFIDNKKVVSIGKFAFCPAFDYPSFGKNTGTRLTSVVIPNSVKTILDNSFLENRLTNVTIPDSVISIGESSFMHNELASLNIPNSVTTIGLGAFQHNRLTNVTISNSLTSIGEASFSYNLLDSVTIPNSLTHIAKDAFSTNLLTSVTLSSSVTHIGNGAFSTNLLTNVSIPNSVTHIGELAFSENLLTTLIIPNSVTTIGSSAFSRNELTSVTIPSSVTSIGTQTFFTNPDLKTVINLSSIENISSYFNSSPNISTTP